MLLPFLPLLFESKTPLWFNSYSTFSSGIRLSFRFLQIQHDMCQESKKSSKIGEFNVSISLLLLSSATFGCDEVWSEGRYTPPGLARRCSYAMKDTVPTFVVLGFSYSMSPICLCGFSK